MTTKPNISEELERLVDASSVLDVLCGLHLICDEKADHIEMNWQDKQLAKSWRRDARTVEAAMRKVSN